MSKKRGMVLDLKGHQYLAHMSRCPALLLVSVGEDEAKVRMHACLHACMHACMPVRPAPCMRDCANEGGT